MKRIILLAVILLALTVIPVQAVDHQFDLTMTDTRILYQIDYGEGSNVTSYSVTTGEDLAPVQSWSVYGSNNGTGWDLIDEQQGIGFTSGAPIVYTVPAVNQYQYYEIHIRDGFYLPTTSLTYIFSDSLTPPTPTPTISPTPTITAAKPSGIPMLPAAAVQTSSYERWAKDNGFWLLIILLGIVAILILKRR